MSIWDPSLQTAVTEFPPGRKTRGRGETECVKESLTGVRRKLSKASWSGFEKSKGRVKKGRKKERCEIRSERKSKGNRKCGLAEVKTHVEKALTAGSVKAAAAAQ